MHFVLPAAYNGCRWTLDNQSSRIREMQKLKSVLWRSFSLALLMVVVPAASSADKLTDEEFRRLHAQLQPATDEPWLTIPWKTSVLDAQRAAAAQKKPIFIWAMDGHPLGCT
jgi:hypothetical protein